MSNYKSEFKNLGNDFFNKQFNVPIYQRLYVWENIQVKTLISDLVTAYNHNKILKDDSEKKDYYLGGIVVVENKVKDEESAHTAREISRTEGLFVGYTSGAAMQALKQLNEEGIFKSTDKVVVVFPDHGSRYMSKVYSDQWMEAQGFFDRHTETAEKIQYVK